MTKMLIDRQVVEHALHVAMVAEHPVKLIAALRAALAEPNTSAVEPVQEPDSPERRCGGPGCDGTCCQPVEEPAALVANGVLVKSELPRGYTGYLYAAPPQRKPQGCEHCNHPLYAAIKCRVCGRVTEPVEPVQEIAWMRVIDEAMVTHHLGVANPADDYGTAKRKMNNLLGMAQDIGTYFADPPQRKPLTEEQKQAIHNETGAGHSLICLVESYINGIKE